MGTTSLPEDIIAPARRQPTGQGAVLAIPVTAERDPDEAVLRQFVHLAGGEAAVIAIISSAATNPAGTGEAYAARFRQIGAREATWLRVWQRCDANSPDVVTALRRATGIFVADGDRGRLRTLLADTRATETILRRNDEGAVVAGITAGSSTLPRPGGTAAVRQERDARAAEWPTGLAALGIGVLAELGAEHHVSEAVEWSGF